MNNFDDWSQIISKYLKSESDPLGSLTKHELEGDAARAAFIRSVLDRFLPETYGVGSGQIMDSKGNLSGKLDIIIYRRDFPRLDLPGTRDIFLYESVIATFEIAAKLVKKTFFEALDQCAALAELSPDIDHKVMTGLAARNQLSLNENKQYVHPDPVRTARFHLIGRPISFIYAFSGYKTSANMMIETIEAWMRERKEKHKPVDMKSLPAVIATQGCFAWRNSAPYTVNENCLMGVGKDDSPVRLIILQLLHTLSRKLRVTTDSYGLKPGLDGYLNRMPPPQIESYIGKAYNPIVGDAATMESSVRRQVETKPVPKPVAKPAVKPQPRLAPKPVVAEAPIKPVSKAVEKPVEKPAVPKAVEKPAEKPAVAEAVVKAVPEKPIAEKTAAVKPAPEKSVFDKPAIDITPRMPVAPPKSETAVDAKSEPLPRATLASLDPKPEAVDAPFPEPNADLIPRLDPNPPEIEATDNSDDSLPRLSMPESKPSAPAKPAPVPSANNQQTGVDIPLEPSAPESKSEPVAAVDSADAFLETVKIQLSTPEPKAKTNGSNSTAADDFMETVKMQMSSPEPIPDLQPESEPKPEPFTSTIPQ